ncbi:hypothetical protein FB451DRAFT_1239464 [Mycena latifolia]|nr:hypothetical protein FB451DRAFT_1239464 [Mycena latifolia]
MDLQSLSLQVPHRTPAPPHLKVLDNLIREMDELLSRMRSQRKNFENVKGDIHEPRSTLEQNHLSSTPSPSTEQYRYKVAKTLPAGYRKPLLELLPTIYKGFEAGDIWALYHSIRSEAPETITRLRRVFDAYGGTMFEINMIYGLLAFVSWLSTCHRGKEGIQQMLADLKRLGPNFDPDRVVKHFAEEVKDLKNSCKNLESLLWTDRSGPTPSLQHRVEELLESIKTSPTLNLDLLEGMEDFTEGYLAFCAISLTGQDTKEKMRELRQLVNRELTKAIERLEKFNSLLTRYTEGGRQDLAAVMQKNVQAARKAGFREGVSSTAESQQIYDDLEKIDNSFVIIGQRLKDSKEFWEGVDRKLNSAPYTPAGQNVKDPPDRSGTESVAQKIQTGLETVHGAAQQYSGSPKILKAGTRLVRRASALTKECTTISSTQSSVEVHLQQPNCNPKSGRKAVSPLGKGFVGALDLPLFWFAGSTPADKLRMERPDHVAHAVLLSKGLPSYLLPFESSLTAIERHLRGIQKLWMNLELMGDGIPRPAW